MHTGTKGEQRLREVDGADRPARREPASIARRPRWQGRGGRSHCAEGPRRLSRSHASPSSINDRRDGSPRMSGLTLGKAGRAKMDPLGHFSP